MRHRIFESPIGPLTLVVDAAGLLCGLYLDGQAHHPGPDAMGERDDTIAGHAVAQLAQYFAGTRTKFDVATAARGTDFQQDVWRELVGIPVGKTRTYGEVAAAIGRPGASRAVGAATGRNPISIIVPCHRLVGAMGKLTGYAGGIERKRWLLDHELGMRS